MWSRPDYKNVDKYETQLFLVWVFHYGSSKTFKNGQKFSKADFYKNVLFCRNQLFELCTVFRQFLGTVVKSAKKKLRLVFIYIFVIIPKIWVLIFWSLKYVYPKYTCFGPSHILDLNLTLPHTHTTWVDGFVNKRKLPFLHKSWILEAKFKY